VARPETHPGVEGEDDEAGSAGPALRDINDHVPPGTGVVRPGTGVVRPTSSGTSSTDSAAAKARAVVPDAPSPDEPPREPIRVVLPVIPVKPVKQGFLDRLVAPKPKKQKRDKGEARQEEPDEPGPVSPAVAATIATPAPPKPAPKPQVALPTPPPPAPAPPAPAPPKPPLALPAPPPPAPAPPRPPFALPAPLSAPPAPPKPTFALPAPASAPTPAPPKPPAAPPQPSLPKPQSPAPPPPKPAPPKPPPPKPAPRKPAPPKPALPPPQVAPPPKPTPAPPVRITPPALPAPGSSARPGPPAAPTRPAPGRWAPSRQAPARHGKHFADDHDTYDHDQYDRRHRYDDAYDRRDQYGGRNVQPRLPVRWIVAAAAAIVVAVGGGALVGATRSGPKPEWHAAGPAAGAAPVLASLSTDAPRPSSAGMTAQLQPLLADGRLGGHVTASVVDVASGATLLDHDGGTSVVPASTAKLLTAAAVLHARGAAYRIPTRAVAGPSPGEVVIVGGGDPTLAAGATSSYPGAARLDVLADQVVKALGGESPSRVIVDSSLYSGPTLSPGWYDSDAKGGFIANITALMTDGGRRDPKRIKNPSPRYERPDLSAGQLFATALGLPASAVSMGTAPTGSKRLGEVLSPPMSRMVELMLSDSDNMIAEGLARQVALAKGKPASFDGGAEATLRVLAEFGLPVDGQALVDGSGFSHQNRISAQLLTAVLVLAGKDNHAHLRSIISGLPVARYSGTLADRYASPNAGGSGAGVVRAKTGTLSGVNTLAGLAVDADGRLLAFSIVADATPKSGPAEAALDRIAAAIASCGCA
jgi:serine-type D-Ala-D-Ala carboxypeptidase/endopeptidase (penicillin-binding protein 4)